MAALIRNTLSYSKIYNLAARPRAKPVMPAMSMAPPSHGMVRLDCDCGAEPSAASAASVVRLDCDCVARGVPCALLLSRDRMEVIDVFSSSYTPAATSSPIT